METNDITAIIVDAAYQIHRDVGSGLFELVYEVLLSDALTLKGLKVARQVLVPIRVGQRQFDEGFRADLIVEDRVNRRNKIDRAVGRRTQEAGSHLHQAFRNECRTPDQLWRRTAQRKYRENCRRRRPRPQTVIPLRVSGPPCETAASSQNSMSENGEHGWRKCDSLPA